MPELGLRFPKRIEIFVDVDVDGPVRVRSKGISMKIGGQSDAFRNCLDYITTFDTGDYGHDCSNTLSISPAPPYSAAQRRGLWRALAHLTLRIDYPMRFWSTQFLTEIDNNLPAKAKRILSFLLRKRLFPRSDAVALVTSIVNRAPPGTFVNAFRLLELCMELLYDTDLKKLRWHKMTSHSNYLKAVATRTASFKERLRFISSSRPGTASVLGRIWQTLRPGHKLNMAEVFNEIAKLRNTTVHGGEGIEMDRHLPWEQPPYHLVACLLLELVAILLDVPPEERSDD